MKIMFNKYVAVFALVLIMSNPSFVHADSNVGSIILTVKYANGDVVPVKPMAIKIYQDSGQIPYLEIDTVNSLPLTISSLPLKHNYKVEVYENSMHAGVGYVDLESDPQNLPVTIPGAMGMTFTVFYNDGSTPIPNAIVSVKSSDDNLWNTGNTNDQGRVPTIWDSTSINDTDFYYAEVSLGKDLFYTYSPIHATTAGSRDYKIVTNWPATIQSLITVPVYKTSSLKVDPLDGKLLVELRDSNNNKVVDSPVNSRGEAYLTNLKVGDYFLVVLKVNDQSGQPNELVNRKITLTGSESILPIYINNPELNGGELNCKCVAFRLDDVQDSYLNSVQLAIIKEFQDRNASLTLGIISGSFGKDRKLVDVIRYGVSGNAFLEPAIHGWDHHDMTLLSRSDQSDEITRSIATLQSIFSIKPVTFIPPYNHYNNDTVSLLQGNGITHISSHVHSQEPPPFVNSQFYYFPATTSTGSAEIQGVPPFKTVVADSIMNDIRNDMPKYGFAVVGMHPYEFSSFGGIYQNAPNQTQLAQLGILIDKVKSEGYKIVPIGKIDSFNIPAVVVQPAPQTNQTTAPKLPNCNCIAFRFEWVQDTFLNNVQNAIIQTFQQKGASLTIGMAGKDIGSNPKVVGLIKDRISSNNPPIEIANRGWENLDHTQYAEEQQSASIKRSSDKISRVFGVTPSVFIPPYDRFNNDTLDAMYENGIRYLSTNAKLDPGPYDLKNAVPFHLPSSATISYLLDDDPFFKGTIYEKAVAKIKLGLNSSGFLVASIRSQDFAVQDGTSYQNQVDTQKLQNLVSLLDYIKNSGIKTVTIDKIPQMATSPKSPSWVNHIYSWYQQGEISHNEVVNAIDYLIGQNVIQFGN